jgi:hypothetical protein
VPWTGVGRAEANRKSGPARTVRTLFDNLTAWRRTLSRKETTMKIKTQPILGGRPSQCHTNVGKRIKALGGSAVFGWQLLDKGVYIQHTPHCIWQAPTGELQDVTPLVTAVIDEEHARIEYPQEIEFIRDDAVAWPLDGAPPPISKYVAKDPKHQKSVDYLRRGDQALDSGDLDTCRYWTERANAELRRLGVPAYFPMPKSLNEADVLDAKT